MLVQEIMTRRVEVIDPETTLAEAAQKMRDEAIGALPVGENDRLIGMITDRDIVVRGVAQDCAPGDTCVREVMSQGICYCFEDEAVETAAELMSERQVRRLPVLNHDRRLVGFLAMADLSLDAGRAAQSALRGVSVPTDGARG